MFALGIALPFLVVWGLGIPAFAFFMMYSVRDKLKMNWVKERYGFLYNGYKPHAYYWEIIIMYRKIALIFIAVFLSSISTIVQAMIVIFFLLGCLGLNTILQPF